MKKEIKFSIILPVYNCEKTIEVAINSVLIQTYPHLELIIIDDGSTDSTYSKCKNLSVEDSRINLITQENKGVSQARNKGIDIVTGDLLLFLDADDYFDFRLLEYIVKTFNSLKPDLIIYGNNFTSPSGNLIMNRKLHNQYYDTLQDFKDCLYKYIYDETINAPWNKVYKVSKVKEHNIKFNKLIDIGEDLEFNIQYLKHTTNILIIEDALINYTVNKKTNLVSKFRPNRFEIRVNLLNQVEDFLIDSGIYDDYGKQLLENMRLKDIWAYFMDLHKKDCDYNFIMKLSEINRIKCNQNAVKILQQIRPLKNTNKILLIFLKFNSVIIFCISKILFLKRLF